MHCLPTTTKKISWNCVNINTVYKMFEPNLYRDNFNYDEVPKVTFNYRLVPMNCPDEIWITDTTFRDGQQSRAPYSTEQIVKLYALCIVWVVQKAKSDNVNFSFTAKTIEKPFVPVRNLELSGNHRLDSCHKRRFPTCKRYGIERMWYIG